MESNDWAAHRKLFQYQYFRLLIKIYFNLTIDRNPQLQITLTNQGQFSGLNDFDYQELSNLTEGRIKDLQQIKTVNKVSIPNEIMDHFKSK